MLLVLLLPASSRADLVPGIAAPPPGHWAVDATGRIHRNTLAGLNRIGSEVDTSGVGQIGVFVTSTTHGIPPREYATRVFNNWGVGHAGRNDGALLFVALDDRAAEIVLGDGVDDFEDVARSERLMADTIVPAFRRGNPDEALLSGARGLSNLLSSARINQGSAPQAASGISHGSQRIHIPSPRPGWVVDLDQLLSPSQARELNKLSWQLESEGQPPITFVFYDYSRTAVEPVVMASYVEHELKLRDRAWIVVAAPHAPLAEILTPRTVTLTESGRSDLHRLAQEWTRAAWALSSSSSDQATRQVLDTAERTRDFTRTGSLPRSADEHITEAIAEHPVATFGGGTGAFALGVMGLFRWLRRRPRRCESCNSPRQLLDEAWDDVHLTEGQKAEEKLGSVDYDVWWCAQCDDALVLRHGTWFSSYARCRSCDHVTAHHSTQTLVHATYDHGGTVEVTELCQHCKHRRSYQRHTSRLTRSDTSSSSSSSWSSSGSRSSFGGGSSSGRGASGRW